MGDSHPSLAPHLQTLALLHWRQGCQDAAINLQRECCKISLLDADTTPKHAEHPGAGHYHLQDRLQSKMHSCNMIQSAWLICTARLLRAS